MVQSTHFPNKRFSPRLHVPTLSRPIRLRAVLGANPAMAMAAVTPGALGLSDVAGRLMRVALVGLGEASRRAQGKKERTQERKKERTKERKRDSERARKKERRRERERERQRERERDSYLTRLAPGSRRPPWKWMA